MEQRTVYVRKPNTQNDLSTTGHWWWVGGSQRWGLFARALRFTSVQAAALDLGHPICPTCHRAEDIEFVEETRDGALTVVTA